MSAGPVICRAVLETLLALYEKRRGGRTGAGTNRISFDYEDLLKRAGCDDGDARAKALEQLQQADHHGWIRLITHRRDATMIQQVEFLPAGEAPLCAALAVLSPTRRREEWSALFQTAASAIVPEVWQDRWQTWCASLAAAASGGEVRAPFRREDPEAGAELLRVLAALLAWPEESLIRFVSCVVCGDSKRLERLRPNLQAALSQLSGGALTFLEELKVMENRRSVLVHGPLVLEFAESSVDLGLLSAPVRVAAADIDNVRALHTTALRCLTVENETSMQELSRRRDGTLFILTSYPTRAVLSLMALLPPDLECWHFGDTDPAGFDILRDLREKTGRTIRPFAMRFRPSSLAAPLNADERRLLERLLSSAPLTDVRPELAAMQQSGTKGDFEQESLGLPAAAWPYYRL